MVSASLRQGPSQHRLAGNFLRWSLVGVVLGLLLLVAAPVAKAAYPQGLGINADGTLSYIAAGGQQNQVFIQLVGDSYSVTDVGVNAIADADGVGGCQIDPSGITANCPAAGVTRIWVNAGDGDDTISLNPSVTVPGLLFGRQGSDNLSGGSGNDTLNGGPGALDTLEGNAGTDTADYSGASTSVTVDLSISSPDTQNTGGGGADSIGNTVENVSGTQFADDLRGAPDRTTLLTGLGGDDRLDIWDAPPGSPDRALCGGGNDTLIADALDTFDSSCESKHIDDGVLPDTEINAPLPPEFTNGASENFSFGALPGKAAVKFECALDPPGGTGTFSTCESPKSYDISTFPAPGGDGTYVFHVRAVDEFGNRDQTPASFTFTIDRQPPASTITESPGDVTGDSTPTFSFESNESGGTFECQVDDGDHVLFCTSPFTVDTPLSDGPHTFTVWATDQAGNVEQTGATVSFRVDSTLAPPPPGTGGAVSGGGTQAGSANVVILGSLVLISGRSVKLVHGRLVPVSLTCSGQHPCSGKLTITSDKPLKRHKHRLMKLGSKRFSIDGNKRLKVFVKLTRAKVRLLKRLRRVKARATIREIDPRGHPRISTRTFTLRAR